MAVSAPLQNAHKRPAGGCREPPKDPLQQPFVFFAVQRAGNNTCPHRDRRVFELTDCVPSHGGGCSEKPPSTESNCQGRTEPRKDLCEIRRRIQSNAHRKVRAASAGKRFKKHWKRRVMDKSIRMNKNDSDGKTLISVGDSAALWVNGTQDYE